MPNRSSTEDALVMPNLDTLDFATLLAPISDDSPTGSDSRATNEFRKADQIVDDATNQEKREKNSGEPPTPAAKLWGPLIPRAVYLLSQQAKDVKVVLWLAQGLARMNGLTGLRDSLRLMHELAERYWPSLHPVPNPDQPEVDVDTGDPLEDERLVLIGGLQTDTMLQILRLAPITDRKGDGPFSYANYLAATHLEMKEATLSEGQRQKDMITTAARETGADFYRRLCDDLQLSKMHLEGLEAVLMAQAETKGPTLGKLRDLLEEITRAVREISRHMIPDEAPDSPTSEKAAKDSHQATGTTTASGFRPSGRNATHDREAALRSLADIAVFFKTTEPHSPIGYTLETLVARARMPLPKLLEDLIPDQSTRETLLTTAGIRLPKSE